MGDVAACASLLKLFLRELKEPIIPPLYQTILLKFQENYCQADEAKLLLRIKEVFRRLSPTRREIVRYLFQFMIDVSHKSEVNKMTPNNLALVFGPSLFRCGTGLKAAEDQGYANGVLMLMLREFEQLFPTMEELCMEPEFPVARLEARRGSVDVMIEGEDPEKRRGEKYSGVLMATLSSCSSLGNASDASGFTMSGVTSASDSEDAADEKTRPYPAIKTEDLLRFEKKQLAKILKMYENYNGRPSTLNEKLTMHPLYSRYKDIKKQIRGENSSIQTVLASTRDSNDKFHDRFNFHNIHADR